jgi:hypothetical protein
VEHEVVHAYCLQAFGATGPDWYKEGMAEVAAFRSHGHLGVQCPEERLQELRTKAPRSITQIVGAEPMTKEISQSMDAMLVAHAQSQGQVALTRWTERDAENTLQARKDYLWTWALCHLLAHNPNYAARFRSLGESYLSNRDDSFERAFGARRQELEFEHRFFLDHVAVGYRADLCAWDWQTRFREPERDDAVRRRVLAARGYQASGLAVVAGRRYKLCAEGAWSTAAEGPLHDAQGADGRGHLEGVILTDFRLNAPLVLGPQAIFTAPASGNLYLRCADAWNELGDNRGEVQVRITEL